jgi:hypothetical protein
VLQFFKGLSAMAKQLERGKPMRNARALLILAGITFGFLQGCRTSKPAPATTTPLKAEDLRAFFTRAADPRRFWITVYDSDQGPAFKGQNRLHPEQLAVLPFADSSDRNAPLVNINAWLGRDFLALIDTTSARNWVSEQAFHALRGIPLGPPAYRFPVVHVREPIPGYAGVFPKLRFDNLHVENALVCAWAARGPFGNLARDVAPVPDIILGMDLLQSFQFVQIDYPARRVFFSSTFPFRPEQDRLLASVPYAEVGGAMAVSGSVDGKPTTILIDTAGDFELAFTNTTLEAVRQLEVGNIVFRNVSVEDAALYDLGLLKHPRIGRQLLSRFRITIDPQARLIHFERPPAKKSIEFKK